MTTRASPTNTNSFQGCDDINRRDVVLGGTALLTATALSHAMLPSLANAQAQKSAGGPPTPGFNQQIPE